MHRYDIRRNAQNQNTHLSNIEIRKYEFKNLSPNLNTHDFGCVAKRTCRASTHVEY